MISRFALLPTLLLAALILGARWSGSSAAAPAAAGDIVPGRYIVVLQQGVDSSAVVASHGLRADLTYHRALTGFAAALSRADIDGLLADPRVNNVVPDRRVSIACHKPQHTCSGGDGSGGTQITPAGVARIGASTVWATATGSGVGVAVLDTGIDFNHTDLSVAPDCYTVFASCQDDHGHGTHVAGTIAARNNSQDVVGVAPGATLFGVKVLDGSGNGTWSGVAAGIDWVTANAGALGIKVANMSLGGGGSDSANCGDPNADGVIDDPLHRSICNSVAAGVTYVVAAGNDPNQDISQNVPAAYPEVIAVASTSALDGSNACRFFSGSIRADTASYFTTDGAGVSISAPGEDKENISRGCLITSLGILSTRLGGGTTRMSGTSMAAPHVAGVAALMLQVNAALSPEDIRSKIESSADRKGVAPLNSPTTSYTFDGEREGVVWTPGALSP